MQGSLSIGSSLSVAGDAFFGGLTALTGTLSLAPAFLLQGLSASLLLSSSDSAISLGGKLRVVGPSALQGDASLFGRLVTGGDTQLGARLSAAGSTSLSDTLTVALDSTLKGGLSVGGSAVLSSDLTLGSNVIFGPGSGALSASSGPTGGIVGAPLLLRGASQLGDFVNAPGLSILGGDAQNGFGGNVVLKGGAKGGDGHWAGSVQLMDSMGELRLSANEAGVAMSGGTWGVISTSPAFLASGLLSVVGASSLLGPTYVEQELTAGANVAVGGTVSVAGDIVQASTGGHLSFAGSLAGSGWLDPQLITVCTSLDWTIGGKCYGLYSESPTQDGIHALLYWNLDNVAHNVIVNGQGTLIPVAPGAMFPVYVANVRRRLLSQQEVEEAHSRLRPSPESVMKAWL